MRSASLLLCVPLLTLACGGTEAGTGGAGGTGGSTSSTGGAGTTGGGGEGGAPVTYRVTVEVVGLDGQLELTLSPGSESLVVTSEGSHSFTAALLDGDAWEVALASAPGLQSCSADVSTGTIGGADASLTITCLDQLAFAASNVDPGDFELWATDGTEAGTRLILDIEPNGSSAPREITAVPGSLVIFTAATDAEGREPWVSDGTPEGTRLLADINPGTSGSSPHGFTLHAGTIYFQAQDPTSGNELWATDGTAAGTKRVADLYTGPNGSYPEYFTVLGDRLLFIASEPTQDSLLAIEPNGTLTTLAPATYDEMRVAAGLAYFSADLDDLGNEPFISDGTAAGTTRLADIATGAASSSPVPLAALPTGMLLRATTPTTGDELYFGDSNGVTFLGDLRAGPIGSNPYPLATVGGKALLALDDGVVGQELWVSDGTPTGTVLLRDSDPNGASYFAPLGVHQGLAYLAILTTTTAESVIVATDGTALGTTILVSFSSTAERGVYPFGELGGKWCFGVIDATSGAEPWCSDGTPEGTTRFLDLCPGTCNSLPVAS